MSKAITPKPKSCFCFPSRRLRDSAPQIYALLIRSVIWRRFTAPSVSTKSRSGSTGKRLRFGRKSWGLDIRMSPQVLIIWPSASSFRGNIVTRSRSLNGRWRSEKRHWARTTRRSPKASSTRCSSVLTIQEQTLGPDHPELAPNLIGLAEMDFIDAAEQERLLLRVPAIIEKAFG